MAAHLASKPFEASECIVDVGLKHRGLDVNCGFMSWLFLVAWQSANAYAVPCEHLFSPAVL